MSGNKSNKEENKIKPKDENEFALILQEKLNKELKDNGVLVSKHKNLIYKVIVKEKFKFESLKFEPETPEDPKRGSNDHAFQKDLLIENLLINECKKLIEKVKLIENDGELINECEELIKNVKNNEECKGLINECKKLIKKYKKLIEKVENSKELINECEELIGKVESNEERKELIKKCEKLVEKCKELIKKVENNEELIKKCEKLVEKVKLIENNIEDKECKELIGKVENDGELINECKELINECEELIGKVESNEKRKELIKKCEKLVEKCKELIKKVENNEELIKKCEKLVEKCEELNKNYVKLNKNDEKLIKKCKELIKNVEIAENNKELIKKCKELIKKFEEYITLTKKCEKKFFLLPLVVIEIKYGSFSTHDVLTYSEKALKHKEIYPYLRYGLLIGQKNKEIAIFNRFFTHNKGFDFAYALKDINNDELIKELAEMIKQQIDSARSLFDILNNENQVKKFNTVIKIEKVSKD